MIDHERDLTHVHEATEKLLAAAASLDNAAVAEPSRLPGWTRGHVLTHVARNADALVNVLQGLPMYADAASREDDIEAGAGRPLDAQLADLRATTERLRAVTAEPADWSRTVEMRNGVRDSASRIPFRRWVEVDLHHVDLGVGYELEDLPEEFVTREIAFLAQRFTGLESVPATTLRSADGGSWTTGGATGGVVVTGPATELVGWLAGRRDGAALTAEGGPLPTLPAL
ncbi:MULTISPECIES: maleylpyruvate isomerase family mycothiol-dependent enzyme [unclassified Streptomyces]|uniref:maleylpyruvate isomerase family mycothiol-dependent enzyme n=1 Tax=unclassified Streptomyces TaxID=2593676 RepID=UPI0016612C74|nr:MULTISPECIES: maleylpyruvate isomerase family mycothiol-dependent enzyme [unclassified Streptomyces]MBD0709200.1 mycothiol maleylpyruvate isomerase [Streptomyces sp. CBMA291]MBD0713531.1 mycothiol maleylpyruvate isomerase [Streptomyces sp. CBMA370]